MAGRALTYEEIMARLEAPVEAFLREQVGLGEGQVLVSQVRRLLNQKNGKPGALAEVVLKRIKARPGSVVREVANGFVYLAAPGGDDGQAG